MNTFSSFFNIKCLKNFQMFFFLVLAIYNCSVVFFISLCIGITFQFEQELNVACLKDEKPIDLLRFSVLP